MVEQGVDADAVLRGNGEDVGDAESVEFVGQAVADLRSVLLTARETGLPRRLSIWARSRSLPVISARPSTRKMMWCGALEGQFRLVEDLPGDVLLVVHDDAAGIDQFEAPAVVFGSPVYAIARDAGFVPDDGAPLSCDAIEKSGLSYVGPAHDDYRGNGI